MKKIPFLRLTLLLGCYSLLILGLVSCEEDTETEVIYQESMVIGYWQDSTVYERYDEDHTGVTWDTSEDVDESEAQSFTWSIDKDILTQIHIMEIGGQIPKVYNILKLTDTVFIYEDDYGVRHSYVKWEKTEG